MKRVLASIVLLLALSALLAGCSASFSTANIPSAVLAKDVQGASYEPVDPTTVFPTDQAVIHLVVTLKNAPSDTVVKAVWSTVDVGDAAAPNTEIDSAEITMQSSGNVHFTLSSPSTGVWPVGTYKVDVYLDGKLNKTLNYSVVGS